MNTIHVALSSDYNYSRPLAVTIASILANAGEDDCFSFHIVDQGLTDECRERIDALRGILDFRLEYLELSAEQLEEAAGCRMDEMVARYGYPGAAFGRVFLPELLTGLATALYLDCDLIVLDSLAPLWSMPLDGRSVVWARDALEYLRPIREDVAAFVESLGLGKDDAYCNTGVMVMNLAKARSNNVPGQFFDQLRQLGGRAKHLDQDVFNILFREDCLVLPSMWNFPDSMSKWSPDFTFASPKFTPKIIHFTAWDKPWKTKHDCVHHGLYHRFAAMTGWRLAAEETA